MLVFCGHFSNGILSRDLKDACALLKFPENWLVGVAYISISSKPNFVDSDDALDTLKREIQTLKDEGSSDLDILAECRRTDSMSTIEILKMTDLSIGDKREILFEVDQEIRGIFYSLKDARIGLFEQKVNILRYYRFLFKAIMELNNRKPFYWESIVECTLINSNQVAWGWNEEIDSPEGVHSYILSDDFHSSMVQDMIRNHDTNIRVLMNSSCPLSLSECFNYISDNEQGDMQGHKNGDRFLQAFERFLLSFWTLLKIHEYYEVALEYVVLYRQLNSTEYSQSKLLICSIKTELFACDVHYRKLKKSRDYCSTEDITLFEVQFKIVESLLQKCKDKDW